jgi:hypothetical protein
MAAALQPPPAVIEILPDGGRWRLQSSDRLFSGVFTDRRSALRHAMAEADSHPGHVVVISPAPEC